MQHSVSNSVSFYCRVSDTVQWGRKKMYQYIRAYCLNIYTYCGKGGKRNHFCLNLLSIKLIFVHPSMPGKHIMISSIGFFFLLSFLLSSSNLVEDQTSKVFHNGSKALLKSDLNLHWNDNQKYPLLTNGPPMRTVVKWGHTKGIPREKTSSEKYTVFSF